MRTLLIAGALLGLVFTCCCCCGGDPGMWGDPEYWEENWEDMMDFDTWEQMLSPGLSNHVFEVVQEYVSDAF